MHIVRARRELISFKTFQLVSIIRRLPVLDIIFFLLIFLFPTQLGKHFWPSFAFISGLRIDYLSPTLYLTDILIFLFVIVAFLKYKKKVLPPKSSVFLYLFFSVGIFLSSNPSSGWYGLFKFTEYLFLGFSLKEYFSQLQEPWFFWLPLSFSIMFESILGLWQYVGQSSVGGIFYFFGERTFTPETPGIANATLGGQLVLRPYATFSHPNVFAGFLCITMIVLVSFWEKFKTRKEKLFILCALALGTSALFATLGRTAIFLWIIFVLFLFSRKFSFSKKWTLLGGILIAAFLVFSPYLRLRFFDATIFGETTEQRILLLNAAWKMILAHFVFGVGFANFLGQLPQYLKQPSMSILLIQPVHNVFFLIAAETGLIGLGIVLWFLAKVATRLKILDKNTNRSKKLRVYSLSFSFFGMLFLGLFDHYFLTLQQGQILATILLAYVFSLSTKKAKNGTIVL